MSTCAHPKLKGVNVIRSQVKRHNYVLCLFYILMLTFLLICRESMNYTCLSSINLKNPWAIRSSICMNKLLNLEGKSDSIQITVNHTIYTCLGRVWGTTNCSKYKHEQDHWRNPNNKWLISLVGVGVPFSKWVFESDH